MAKNIGLNLGPILGPLASKRPDPISGRWVTIKRYEGGNTNPLQGGHWVDEGYWVDPPTEWGGGGIDPVGGGGTSFYNPYPPPPPPPPVNCPVWMEEPVAGGGAVKHTCTPAQQELLQFNYHYLVTQMAPYLSQFIDMEGYSLLECMKEKWCGIVIDCKQYDDPDGLDGEYTDDPSSAIPVPFLTLYPSMFTYEQDSRGVQFARYDLLGLLIKMCGGTELDALAISSYDPNEPRWGGYSNVADHNSNWGDSLCANCPIDIVEDPSVPGKMRRVLRGRWVWWDRDNGDVGVVPDISNVLNGDRNEKDKNKKMWRF
ncbi:MAG: hypothetical protein JST22_19215 [Bacteroidetes bacterium]|nr:hypothetical protein [Bacteroidota bacterium]